MPDLTQIFGAAGGFCACLLLVVGACKWFINGVLERHSTMLLDKINGKYVKAEVLNAITLAYDRRLDRLEDNVFDTPRHSNS